MRIKKRAGFEFGVVGKELGTLQIFDGDLEEVKTKLKEPWAPDGKGAMADPSRGVGYSAKAEHYTRMLVCQTLTAQNRAPELDDDMIRSMTDMAEMMVEPDKRAFLDSVGGRKRFLWALNCLGSELGLSEKYEVLQRLGIERTPEAEYDLKEAFIQDIAHIGFKWDTEQMQWDAYDQYTDRLEQDRIREGIDPNDHNAPAYITQRAGTTETIDERRDTYTKHIDRAKYMRQAELYDLWKDVCDIRYNNVPYAGPMKKVLFSQEDMAVMKKELKEALGDDYQESRMVAIADEAYKKAYERVTKRARDTALGQSQVAYSKEPMMKQGKDTAVAAADRDMDELMHGVEPDDGPGGEFGQDLEDWTPGN